MYFLIILISLFTAQAIAQTTTDLYFSKIKNDPDQLTRFERQFA